MLFLGGRNYLFVSRGQGSSIAAEMKEGPHNVVYYFMVICILWAVSAEALHVKDISVAHGQMSLRGKDFKAKPILGDKIEEAKSKEEIRSIAEVDADKSKNIEPNKTEMWVDQSDYRDPTTHPVTPSP